MHTIKNIQKFRENQLKLGIAASGSWHKDYDSAYIFIGNLNYGMNQGDIIVDLRLARDRETGKSRGFAFLAYEDQRSTDLAVDNFNGADVCGRVLRVDHVRKYNPPKQFFQINGNQEKQQYRPTGPDGRGWGKYRNKTEEQIKIEKRYKEVKKQQEIKIKKQIGICQ